MCITRSFCPCTARARTHATLIHDCGAYGIVLLPVSVAYTFYALWQYLNRSYMIKNREPGPYLDVMGPVTLTVILMASIIAQFCAKIHAMVNE